VTVPGVEPSPLDLSQPSQSLKLEPLAHRLQRRESLLQLRVRAIADRNRSERLDRGSKPAHVRTVEHTFDSTSSVEIRP
jgi:hypothetical protein